MIIKLISVIVASAICFCGNAFAVEVSPPHWWSGMKSDSLQLMVEGKNIAGATVAIDNPTSQGRIEVVKATSLDSPNYLFVDLILSDAKPGVYTLTFRQDGEVVARTHYELKQRQQEASSRNSFGPRDVIYLITPDRFANGNSNNDTVSGYRDELDRSAKGGRHGGDIQGIIDHLEYLSDMGFTQIWTMPLLENAMESYSYHGYSTTDYYQIDPRFGSNTLYQQLSAKASSFGIGIIMDMVLNHIGSNHPWVGDPPSADWIHNEGKFTPTSHRRESLHDPHAAQIDKIAFSNGWFVPTMPDLNQTNPFLATYLIQNAIWWVEYANLQGIRVDTYSYSDKAFLAKWTAHLTEEYPNLNIVGEEWTTNPLITAYWQRGSQRHDNYVSHLPSVMDFPLQAGLISALTSPETWATGLRQVYEVLASDFIYGDPYNLVVFTDNHDMSRIFSQLNEDKALWDMAMTFILTTRGIPQVFYGTEILMSNPGTEDHGVIRSDFPGGWPFDKVSAFTGEGLTDDQKWAQQRVKSLLHLRKKLPVLSEGKLSHYAPEDGVYTYFRHYPDQRESAVMVTLNKQEQSVVLDLKRFTQHLEGFTQARRLADNQHVILGESQDDTLTLPPLSATVWILQ